MQRQDGTTNAFPRTFQLDYGPNGINLQWDQNNVISTDNALVDSGHPVIDWIDQSGSSTNIHAPLHFQDLFPKDGLLSNRIDQCSSSMSTQIPGRFQDLFSAVPDQSLVERHSEPKGYAFEPSAINRPLPLQEASSITLPQNLDINAVCDNRGIDAYLNTRTDFCLNPFKPPGRQIADQKPFAVDTSISDPLVISSGISGYVLEENESGEGHSSDGKRLCCKRRAPEDGFRLLPLGESSTSTLTTATTQENDSRRLNLSHTNIHPNVSYSEHLGTGLVVGSETGTVVHQPSNAARSGLEAGSRASSNVHQTLWEVGEAENSNRNIRMRRTAIHEDFAPVDMSMLTSRNSYAQLPGQSAVLFPFDCAPNTSSVTRVLQSTHVPQSVISPNSIDALQPFQWSTVTRSRAGLPTAGYSTLHGRAALLLQDDSRNNGSNSMIPSDLPSRNLEHMLTNLNFVQAINSLGNIASSSRNTSCTHPFLAPISLFPQVNRAQRYAQRIPNMINRTESQGQGSYSPRHLALSLATRERELSVRGGNARPSRMPYRSGLIARAERHTGAHPEVTLTSSTTAQRRSRMISEVHNALALVRRGGSLQLEDVMVIDRSVLYGVPEESDIHEDMRLDVDNMSYEELLALEDQIGNVCTGISEDAIQSLMKRQRYQAIEVGPSQKDEPCCICQEEYADGQDLGKLDCGHDFHFNCIKQWLVQKNNCPICKVTALEI